MRRAPLVVWVSASVLALLYLSAVFAPFVAPYDFGEQFRSFPSCPPSRLHLNPPWRWDEAVVYTYDYRLADPLTRTYEPLRDRPVAIRLLRGGRLFSVEGGSRVFLMGTDSLGRDLFSRIVHGGRISLSIGVVGVLLSFSIGLLAGSFAGYVGGWVDNAIMRLVEVEMSLPPFYLLLALASVIPPTLSPAQTFFVIVLLMSFIRWAGFARIIRGMTASLREREYVVAARALGASRARIILRHIIPSTWGYTIVAATLSIPGFILGESALSLLGLGIQEPSASWGNLLAEAQNVQRMVDHPWILIPGVFIFVTIMAFNFLGDWLRDRLDPRGAA